jgi:NAD+ synthase (glutamine-hydrolysing)
LDGILNLHIEEQLCLDEIVAEGYDAKLVAEVLRKVRVNEWKRLQFAPVLKVSPMSFGIDRRVPIS